MIGGASIGATCRFAAAPEPQCSAGVQVLCVPMGPIITSDIVEAYALCPRKAFLLLRGEQVKVPHEYARIIEEQEAENRQAYRAGMVEAAGATGARHPADLEAGHDVILDAVVVADGLEARCDALTTSKGTVGKRGCSYEPVKVLGTRQVTKSQIVGLAYLGHVLGQVQPRPSATGTLIRLGGQVVPGEARGEAQGRAVRSSQP